MKWEAYLEIWVSLVNRLMGLKFDFLCHCPQASTLKLFLLWSVRKSAKEAGEVVGEHLGESAIALATYKVANKVSNNSSSKTQYPANPGKPFNPNGPSIQIGVDPNTIVIDREILPSKLNHVSQIARNDVICDGNHRTELARMMGWTIDVEVR